MLKTLREGFVRRPFRRNLFDILLLVGIIILSACNSTGSDPENPHFTIGFSQCVGSDFWRKTMLDEMKRELSFHPRVTFLYKDADNSNAKQEQQVRSLLEKGIDLLIISPNEAKPLTPVVEEAFKRGIPVIVVDRKISSNSYTAYVGADNFEIGKMAGRYIAGRLKGKGNVLEVMGLPGSSPAIERQRGFYHTLKNYPQIHLIKQIYGNWLIQKAEEEVSKVAGSNTRIDAVFAHNDPMALGSYRAFKSYRPSYDIKIIGVDALPGNGLNLVSKRILDASLLYPTGGKESIRTALAILNREPFEKENILKTVVIDSSNAQLMKMQSDKINSQQQDIERQQRMLDEQRKIYKSKMIILNILGISLFSAVVFGAIAFISFRENRKKNKKLKAQNQEILDQRNLLIEMSAKAEEASEAKFNFFTNISHEFRTPLTLILIPLEELINDDKVPALMKSHLHLMNKNVIRLLRMVNQLIDFRKIEYDKMKIKATKNNIVTFTKDIVDSFKNIADKRNIDLKLASSEKEIKVWFDMNMLDKVFFNLLSNAFKFTKDHGYVHVLIEKKAKEGLVEIRVQDNGIGMDEEEMLHAFDFFYQGKLEYQKGSGLGLSLSKEIIQLHKGCIDVTSKKGKGTTFRILLSTGEDHLSEEEKIATLKESRPDYNDIKIYTTELEEKDKTQVFEPSRELKEQSVLIIEDNEDMLDFLKQKLQTDYEVYTARDGDAGLSEAFEKVPDLILSDIVLPSPSGIEITRILKNDFRTSHIPVILLTAKQNQEQQIEGLKIMADGYITKPFNVRHLTETIKNLLFNRNLLKVHFSSDYPADINLPVPKKLDKKFINDFMRLVENNIANENFSVDDLCRSLGISRIQLYRKVKALLDCNITDYILNRRLHKAKYLLLNEDLSISEITYQVGFSSPAYFSSVFKSKYGCTPTEFKKKKPSLN